MTTDAPIELTPIKTIEVDFGKPADFTPPLIDDLIDQLAAEAWSVRENKLDVFFRDREIWEKSLTPEESKEYDRLVAVAREAEENYDLDRDPPQGEMAHAYEAAVKAKEEFADSHGRHLCAPCAYYSSPDKKGELASCSFYRKSVRPFCLACPYFTTNPTPETREATEAHARFIAAHPDESIRSRELTKHNTPTKSTIASTLSSLYNSLSNCSEEDQKAYAEALQRIFPIAFSKSSPPSPKEVEEALSHLTSTPPSPTPETTTPPPTPTTTPTPANQQ